MKKLTLFLLTLFWALQTVNAQNKDVKTQVNEMYSHVFKWYIEHTNDTSSPQDNYDSLYFSTELKQLIAKANDISEQTGDVVIDYDYWIAAQDWDKDLSFKVLKATKKCGKKATATICIHNCGSDTNVNIALVYERGKWLIDDINGLRKALKDNLKNYKRKHRSTSLSTIKQNLKKKKSEPLRLALQIEIDLDKVGLFYFPFVDSE
ncbi:MAG: DUF3828 domain-containing protein [Prevotella sp.]|nr:DUF3828 domain-containing protein [Prevotella sp.]